MLIIDLLDDEIKIPFVSLELIEYLKNTYSLDYVLDIQTCKNNDEHIGYLRGIYEVLNKLEYLAKRGDNN